MAHPQTVYAQTQFHGPSFLERRRRVMSCTTLRVQLAQLKSTGRYDCFKLKWHPIYDDKSMWPVPFHLFWDSDVAKWIEGACYFLQDEFDAEIDAAVRELACMIQSAQQPDGYLNVHYTVVEPGRRWTNLRDMHELYNLGHLIEAALAHHAYYKNSLLLDVALRLVSHISQTFGPKEGQLHGFPGHPEVELALLRLYSVTKHQPAFDLAKYFLEERGNPTGQNGQNYYDWEAEQRNESPYQRPDAYPEKASHWYCQAHLPILQQPTVEGHAVRAVYLLIAVADLVCLGSAGRSPVPITAGWKAALYRLWENMVDKKMYITGGIGAIKQWEGFGREYFLPQGTDDGGCYAETCASIAVVMLAERMLSFDLDSRYADVMELCLFNVIATAMSLDGKSFTYVNQLASSDADKSARADWFWCACCPPNLLRLFGSLGGYLWDYGGERNSAYVNIHLYATAQLTFTVDDDKTVTLEQVTEWPWQGKISFHLEAPAGVDTTLRLRLPAWAKGQYSLSPSPNPDDASLAESGYICLHPNYTSLHPRFAIDIGGFAPRYIQPHPNVNQQTLALARGPVIYCVEDIDNGDETNHFKDAVISMSSDILEESRVLEQDKDKEPYVALKTTMWQRQVPSSSAAASRGSPYMEAAEPSYADPQLAVFVPYYLRANRGGRGHMRVGLLRKQ